METFGEMKTALRTAVNMELDGPRRGCRRGLRRPDDMPSKKLAQEQINHLMLRLFDSSYVGTLLSVEKVILLWTLHFQNHSEYHAWLNRLVAVTRMQGYHGRLDGSHDQKPVLLDDTPETVLKNKPDTKKAHIKELSLENSPDAEKASRAKTDADLTDVLDRMLALDMGKN